MVTPITHHPILPHIRKKASNVLVLTAETLHSQNNIVVFGELNVKFGTHVLHMVWRIKEYSDEFHGVLLSFQRKEMPQ